MSAPLYAIGDIHGHLDQMEHALDLIHADGGASSEIVFLGDYVDRGPDSRAVIERLMQGVAEGRNWHVLRGNHDRMFCRFVENGTLSDARIKSGLQWFNPRLGGTETLAAYGIDATEGDPTAPILQAAQSAVPAAHVDFLRGRDLYLERDGLLFAHAGILPGVALADQTEDDLIWIRDGFLTHDKPHPWLVVHGHTALEFPHHFGNRIDLDGGTGYGRPLYPAVFEGTECCLLTPDGRQHLRPPLD